MDEMVSQGRFDYEALDEETRLFVRQKADETHGLMTRTAEQIIRIGENLLAVKARLPDLHFAAWLRAEFALSRPSAYRYMQVAERFGERCLTVRHLSATVLYELAAPSTPDAVIEQVQIGEVLPTVEAIRAAKDAERQAREREQQAQADIQRVQQQLSTEREEGLATIAHLTQQIEALHQQMQAISSSPVQVQEVPVVPQEVTAHLETLRQSVRTLTEQRDQLSQEVQTLNAQMRAEYLKHQEGDADRRIRVNWYQITTAFHSSVQKLFAQWPTALDVQAFDADAWARLSQMKEQARRVQEACTALSDGLHGRVIEAGSGDEGEGQGTREDTS